MLRITASLPQTLLALTPTFKIPPTTLGM
jgi:hypothetical protein